VFTSKSHKVLRDIYELFVDFFAWSMKHGGHLCLVLLTFAKIINFIVLLWIYRKVLVHFHIR
jgi:hypothetical protein